MNRLYTSKKSPLVAGILSVVPGVGQIYNEQTGKGLLLFLLFVFTFLFFVFRLSPFSLISFYSPHGNYETPDSFFQHSEMIRLSMPFGYMNMSRIYPLLWFIVILPFMVIFSIADAVQNARRINLGFVHAPSGSTPSPPPHPGSQTGDQPVQQDTLRKEAEQKMGGPPPFTGTFQSTTEEPMQSQDPNTSNPNAGAPPKCTRGISGKFLVGIVLVVIGGLYIMDDFLGLPVWRLISWNTFWPLIPLAFGLRLLRDYFHDNDKGQFVLGMIFTSIGGVFLIENWTPFEIVELLQDFWMFILFAVGVLFLLSDLTDRRKTRN